MDISKRCHIFYEILFFLFMCTSCTEINSFVAKEKVNNILNKQVLCKDCNVIFISLTNVRSDHLGVYGYSRNTSPVIDSFAKKSIVFDNAYSVSSWTLSSAVSLYTSTYPFAHRVISRYPINDKIVISKLPDRIITLIDILNKNGYETASFNGSWDYDPKFGLTGRFKSNFPVLVENKGLWAQQGSIRSMFPHIENWLTQNKDRPFFVHIQAYDAHCPFAYPEENRMFDRNYTGSIDFSYCYWTFDRIRPTFILKNGKLKKFFSLMSGGRVPPIWKKFLTNRDLQHMIALYDGEIFNLDSLIGKIFYKLKTLRLLNKTIIVLFSEHGDMFGEHGRVMRGGPLRGTFYDDVLHVPLIIYHPHLKHKRIKALVSLIDIAPTILDFLGINPPGEFKGKSFIPLLTGEKDVIRDYVFAGSMYITSSDENSIFRYSTLVASVRNSSWKLIKEIVKYSDRTNVWYELFDKRRDPYELKNVALDHFERLEELNSVLESWLNSFSVKEEFFNLKHVILYTPSKDGGYAQMMCKDTYEDVCPVP